MRSRGIVPIILERADQQANRAGRGQPGGRPQSFDPVVHKHRNLVERAFQRIKTWRGLATRYDKHAHNYRGGLLLRALLDWATSVSAARAVAHIL